MICEHPECTGNHRNQARPDGTEVCPMAVIRNRDAARIYSQSRRLSPYVYAVLIDGEVLKIGYSTNAYFRQRADVKWRFKVRGYGTAEVVKMIWHHRGDKGLETFLQWRAGRVWKPMSHGSRHSEWFDVTGVSPQDVTKHLRRWYTQIEKLDEWDAEQERQVP